MDREPVNEPVNPSACFVLIPGAGGSAFYWHRVVPLLIEARQQAIAVELPAGDDSAGLDRYREVIIEAVTRGNVDGLPVVVVAQSMGGLVAPLVCDQLAASRLVLLNAMIPQPGESGGQWWETTGQSQAAAAAALADGRDPASLGDTESTFFHDVADQVKQAVYANGDFTQSDRPFADPWPMSAWPTVPTKVIAATNDRLFPVEFQRRLAAERLGVTIEEIPGGHLTALAQPEVLVDRLLADRSK